VGLKGNNTRLTMLQRKSRLVLLLLLSIGSIITLYSADLWSTSDDSALFRAVAAPPPYPPPPDEQLPSQSNDRQIETRADSEHAARNGQHQSLSSDDSESPKSNPEVRDRDPSSISSSAMSDSELFGSSVDSSNPSAFQGKNETHLKKVHSPCALQLLAILRSAASLKLREDVGYPRFPLIGVVLETDGDGVVRLEAVYPTERRAWFRGKELVTHTIQIMRNATVPMVYYFCAHDVDLWTIVQDYPTQTSALEQQLRLLLGECPALWFLSWNPVADLNSGRVGPRTVPIPDYHAPRYYRLLRAAPLQQRLRGISWRGVTTGRWDNGSYQTSDRYLAVNALQRLRGLSDVKFTQRVQDVGPNVVAQSLMGEPRHLAQMMTRQQVLDVDGNANAWTSLRWKLSAGLVVVKVKSTRGFIQWYYPWLQDGVHLKLVDVHTDDLPRVVYNLCDGANWVSCRYMELNAMSFGWRMLSPPTALQYMIRVLGNIYRWNRTLATRDWRIRPSLDDITPL
jgi:hypothetical protein